MVMDDVPLFVSVMTFRAPLPPTGTDTQFRFVGLTVAVPPEVVTPVPAKATFCGLLVAESVKLKVALRAPAAAGLNAMDAVQESEAARLVLHVLLAMLKSPAFVPDIATLLNVIEELSPFDRVAVCVVLLDPTFVLANVRLVGLADTVPVDEVPSPVSVMV